MKRYMLCFLLLVPVLLGAQVIGILYHPSTITNLMEGDCRTKRVMEASELVLHPRFQTIQLVGLRDLYRVAEDSNPQLFRYYVFRDVGEGMLLEDTGMTDGVLAATIKKAGVYYGVLNGPNCAMVVRMDVGLEPLACTESILYECCVLMEGLN